MYKQGNLKLIVLKNLQGNELKGLDLINRIKEQTGVWKPSAGSIYPLLKKLEEDGLVKIKQSGRIKFYSLTGKGRRFLNTLGKKKDVLVDNIIDAIKFYSSISGNKEEVEYLIKLLADMKKDYMVFAEIAPELLEFRKSIMEAIPKKSRMGDVKKILSNASRKLNKL